MSRPTGSSAAFPRSEASACRPPGPAPHRARRTRHRFRVTDPWIRRPSSVILHAAFVPRRATCVLVHCSPPRSWRWSSRWPPAGVTTAPPRPRSRPDDTSTSAAAEAETALHRRHRPAGPGLRQGRADGLDRPGVPAAVLAATSRPASTRASTSTWPPRSPSGSASTSPGRRPRGTSSPRAAGTAAGTPPSGSMTPTNDRQKVLYFTAAVQLHAGRGRGRGRRRRRSAT